MKKNFDEKYYEDKINALLRVMKVLCVGVAVVLVALVVFAAVSTATSLVASDPDTFVLVSVIIGIILIGLIIALVSILVVARVNYSAYEKQFKGSAKVKPEKTDKK